MDLSGTKRAITDQGWFLSLAVSNIGERAKIVCEINPVASNNSVWRLIAQLLALAPTHCNFNLALKRVASAIPVYRSQVRRDDTHKMRADSMCGYTLQRTGVYINAQRWLLMMAGCHRIYT